MTAHYITEMGFFKRKQPEELLLLSSVTDIYYTLLSSQSPTCKLLP